VIPFKLINWEPVDIRYRNKFGNFDYEPFIVKMSFYLLNILTPSVDRSLLNTFLYWSTLQERAIGNLIPVESENDTSLQDYLWNKTGSFFLRKDRGQQWVADFSYMENFTVRNGFYRYGGLIKFNNDGLIHSIKYLDIEYVSPKIPKWLEEVIKSTIAVISVIELHLLRIHILTAQTQTLQWRNIPAANSLVPLYKVITFGTLDINRKLNTILPIINNLIAFDGQSILDYQDMIIQKGKLTTDEIYGYPGTSWNKKMSEYSKNVESWLYKMYGYVDQNILTYILISSAGHNQFGDAAINNLVVTGFFQPKVRIGDNLWNKVSYQEVKELQTIGVLVSNRLPLFSSTEWFQHFRGEQKKACVEFQRYMCEQQMGWFSPSYFEISIGV